MNPYLREAQVLLAEEAEQGQREADEERLWRGLCVMPVLRPGDAENGREGL